MLKVTIYNEGVHEKLEAHIAEVYPEGIHGQLKKVLSDEFEVTTYTLETINEITTEVLNNTDVLLWWGHMRHNEVPDEVAARVRDAVHGGMGLIVLHSGHYSKIFKKLMGTTCSLKWRDCERERIWCIKPNHPVAAGVDETFVLDPEEFLDALCSGGKNVTIHGNVFDIDDEEYRFISNMGETSYVNTDKIDFSDELDDEAKKENGYDDYD